MSALEIDGVTVRFGGLTALERVSFRVEQGSVLSLIGPNGSGKSTLFDCITGRLRPASGSVRFDGVALTGMRPDRIARLSVSRTFQDGCSFGAETATDNVLLGLHARMTETRRAAVARALWSSTARREEREQRTRARSVLTSLGCGSVLDTRVADLPRSTRSWIEIARALAPGPRLLLLDEPSRGMDAADRSRLGERLRTLAADTGLTVVLVEHRLDLALSVAQQVVVLDAGRVLAAGTPGEVRGHPGVAEAYLQHA